jgi:hypothetical protein
MQSATYRGYRIGYHCESKWFAHIYRPSSPLIMRNGTVQATREEGEAVLLERARVRIDEAEARLPPIKPRPVK